MTHRLSILFVAGALSLSSHGVRAATFHVATDGNDAWSGKLAEPNAARTDGPFATLQRARQAVRGLKAAGPLLDPVTVYLRGGVYRVEKTVEFTPETARRA